MTPSGRRKAAATGQAGCPRTSSRVQSGILLQPRPGAFVGAPNDLETELERLVLDIGGPVWVSGPTAAALHGFAPFELAEPFHLLVPAGLEIRRAGVRVVQSAHVDWVDLGVRNGFPVTRAPRTIIELARTASPEQLALAVESGVDVRLLNIHILRRRAVALATEPGVAVLRGVLERRDRERGECWLAAEFARLLEHHGVRRPRTEVFRDPATGWVARVECRFERSDLVVALVSRVAESPTGGLGDHRGPRRLLVFTDVQVVMTPREVAMATGDALHPPNLLDSVARRLEGPQAGGTTS